MKKSTIMSLVSYLNGETITNLDEIRNELTAELRKGEEKAQANRDLYESAREIVLAGLAETNVGVTVSELYESIMDNLPEGFTKGKLSYALSRGMWEGIERVSEGRTNLYKLA